MKLNSLFSFLCILALSFMSNNLTAQDGHYWTQQYGTESMLLSGSVIGGVNDLGAVYYNPARLSQITNPAFLLSADVYEWNKLTVEDAFGNNKDAAKSEIGGVPSLAAGTFKIPFLKNHYFAWAILQRQNMDITIGYKNEVHDDVFENFPGEEYFGAEITQSGRGKEQWMGLSWAYPFNEKFSIGASGYFSQINNGKSNIINLQALSESNQVAIYRTNHNYSYSHKSLLFKAGLSYQAEKYILGFTILTPSIRLKGDGNYQDELFFSGIEGSSEEEDQYKTSYQNGLRTEYHSPWSAGLGLTFFPGRSKIHFSAEWFSAIPKYTIMESATYIGQSVGDTNSFRLVDEFNSVINAGVGLELFLSEKISFYTSFSTDFSAVVDDGTRFTAGEGEANSAVFRSDFYHFGGGFVLDVKGADITLGVTHTGANMTMPRPFTFPEDGDDDIFDPDDLLTVAWDRWRVVFSFSLPFLKDVQRKAEEKLGF